MFPGADPPVGVGSTTGRILNMRVTKGSQVTIPKELRDQLALGAGSEVDFERSEDAILIRKVSSGPSRAAGWLSACGDAAILR